MELILIASVVVLFLVYIALTRYDYRDQYDVPKIDSSVQSSVKEESLVEKFDAVETEVQTVISAPVKKPRKPRTKKVESTVVEKKTKTTKSKKKKSV